MRGRCVNQKSFSWLDNRSVCKCMIFSGGTIWIYMKHGRVALHLPEAAVGIDIEIRPLKQNHAVPSKTCTSIPHRHHRILDRSHQASLSLPAPLSDIAKHVIGATKSREVGILAR